MNKPHHYVLGIDDDYIAHGTYLTLSAASAAADTAWLNEATWKVDIEARTEAGDTLWVETVHEDDEALDDSDLLDTLL